MRALPRFAGLGLLLALLLGMGYWLWQPQGPVVSDQVTIINPAAAVPGQPQTASPNADDRLTRSGVAAAAEGDAHTASQPRAALTLRITDPNGQPIAGALVRCGAPDMSPYGSVDDRDWSDANLPVYAETRSGTDGMARLDGLPELVEVLVAVETPDHTRSQDLVRTPAAGEPVDLGAWTIEPVPAVTLTFVDQEGHPAADLDFELSVNWKEDDRRDDTLESRTDAAGVAIVQHAAPGFAGLWIDADGRYATRRAERVLQPGQREARVVLDAGLTVSGRMLEADGTPVSGAVIGLHLWSHDEAQEGELAYPWSMSHVDFAGFQSGVVTGPDGSFVCRGLPREQKLFALTAFIAPNQYYAGRWTSRPENCEFRIPNRHRLQGIIRGPFDPAQATVQTEQFWERRKKGEVPVEPEFVWEVHDEVRPCGPGGEFERLLPEGDWKVTVVYPGGAETLDDKLSLTKDRDLGTLTVGAGAAIRVIWPGAEAAAQADLTIERREMVEAGWFSDEEELDWNRLREVEAHPEGAGAWLFQGLDAGEYRIILDGPGWEPTAAILEIGAEDRRDVTLEPPRAGGLIVTVTDVSGAPCTDREVTVRAEVADPMTPREELLNEASRHYPRMEMQLGPDGRARTRDLPAGTYVVYLGQAQSDSDSWSSEEGAEVGRVEIRPGETAHLDVSLAFMGQVQFVVRSEGRAAAGVRLAFWKLQDGGNMSWGGFSDPRSGGETAPDGTYTAPGLAPGQYLVGARSEPRSPWTVREMTVVPGPQSVSLDLAQGQLTGRVVDGNGAPAEAWIELCSEDVGRFTLDPEDQPDRMGLDMWSSACGMVSRPTLPDGSFHLRGVAPGRYRVVASAEQSVAWSGWIEVREGAAADAGELRLLPTAEIEWTVRGCAVWQDYWPRLVFRPAAGGEVWETETLFVYDDKDEDTVRLELPIGTWTVEMMDWDGANLGSIGQIQIQAEVPPPPLLLPSPATVGAKPLP